MDWFEQLAERARKRELVILAGAGVSSGKPSALPGWYGLNHLIVEALQVRLETGLEREGWLARIVPNISALRLAGQFPPDYQAQIIEEMCGERYFRALQSLDVDVTNRMHDGIAALAQAGALRAIVTTNFDPLIEVALERCGVTYDPAIDDQDYLRLGSTEPAGVPVIKIHGSVTDHLSMIDTLKQRKRGRSADLQFCLDPLFEYHWLYLGFSAEDLAADENYLGLVRAASTGSGTFIIYPSAKELGKGAVRLQTAYGERGAFERLYVEDVLDRLCVSLGVAPAAPRLDESLGPPLVKARLAEWASTLSLAATGLCLAAIFEAAGDSETAVRVMDRLIRKEIYEERGTPDFELLQLHYGRLGAAFGRFMNVPDLNGVPSNASVETEQSLLRLSNTPLGFAASSWFGCMMLWRNMGQDATRIASAILLGFAEGRWREEWRPRSDEETIDAWLSAATIFFLNTHVETLRIVLQTFPAVLEQSRRSGDVVRTARVIALHLLAYAETGEDLPAIAEKYKLEFQEVERVGDGFALGFRALALGRWHVGAGGLALARAAAEPRTIAETAMKYLNDAVLRFQAQGMDPWVFFTGIQQAKALTDLRRFETLQRWMDQLLGSLDRFPIFGSHLFEAAAQIQHAIDNPDAADSYQRALELANESGLEFRFKMLEERGV